MRCPGCGAECSDQAKACDFCGVAFGQSPADVPEPTPLAEVTAPPPPIEASSPPLPPPRAPEPDPYSPGSQATRPGASVPNHLTFAIVSTVVSTLVTMLACCCLPLGLPSGIAAIVFALKVNKHFEVGDIDGALRASKTAKMWCWVTTALAIIFGVLLVFSFALHGSQLMDPEFLENLAKQMEAGR